MSCSWVRCRCREARPRHGRLGDAHVDLGGSRLAQELHQLLRGVAAHDGVVHDHEALALDRALEGVELQPDALLAQSWLGEMNVRPT